VETFAIRDLSFSYPEQRKKAIDHVSLSVQPGECLLLCGPSGCGKSTLLRQLKSVLAPHGQREGDILFEGKPIDTLDQRLQSAKIGFVMQSPEHQIVTDKVWHELAFGLESLGLDTPTIRRRVAEMASFFGIQNWFHKNVTDLSGGQKQLLNLASIMAMQPSVLILDEPTSQLDPIAASDFLATVGKINRELGTTILLTEHRLEDAFPLTSRVAVMEEGRILCQGSPADVGEKLRQTQHGMFLAMPTPMRIWAGVETRERCPITVREGKAWLRGYAKEHPLTEVATRKPRSVVEETLISAKDLWFKYEKNLPDVVKGLTMTLHRGEFLALLGGNGTGKSTCLGLLAGFRKAYRGELQVEGSLGYLPQNPQTLFLKKTVREDLYEVLQGKGLSQSQQVEKLARVVTLCRLTSLLDRHPYDLSGGEQQRAALSKVLLLDPEILLLDEPTKGLDAEFKRVFAEILQVLLRRGVSILMVSHDIEFCAHYAHRCALFFQGTIVTEGEPRSFFSGNSFYTTAANRMSRELLNEAITVEDVISACRGELPEEAKLPTEDEPLPEPEEHSASAKPKKLPWWRKGIAVLAAGLVAFLFYRAIKISDLSAVVGQNGLEVGFGSQYFYLYVLLLVSLLVLAAAVGRRSVAPPMAIKTPKEKRTLPKRTLLAAALILLLIPLTLYVGIVYFSGNKYYFISLMVMLECMLPFFLIFEGRKPQARELVIIAVLCALGVAGRALMFMLPQFKPILALVVISGVALGGETGFLVGALTMLASNVLFSQGPWTPWQMFAMGIIGFLAGILFRKGLLRRTRVSLAVFGGLCAVLIYGGIMNPASLLIWSQTITWKIVLAYYVTGLPMDLVHGAATAIILWFAALPMLEKLDRIKVKYGLVE